MQDQDTERMGQQIDRVAADGGRILGAANNAGDFLNMLEDGQFGTELHRDLGELAATMSDLATATGKKAKGKLTITVDFVTQDLAGGKVFMAVPKYVIKAPEQGRKPTMLFTDENNRFTRTQPRHGQFFGVREINAAPGSVREVR